MSGDDSSPPSPRPPLVKATAAGLAAGRAKRLAYEAQRRRYTEACHRQRAGLADDPEEEPGEGTAPAQGSRPGKLRTRARGKVHDPRRGSFEV